MQRIRRIRPKYVSLLEVNKYAMRVSSRCPLKGKVLGST